MLAWATSSRNSPASAQSLDRTGSRFPSVAEAPLRKISVFAIHLMSGGGKSYELMLELSCILRLLPISIAFFYGLVRINIEFTIWVTIWIICIKKQSSINFTVILSWQQRTGATMNDGFKFAFNKLFIFDLLFCSLLCMIIMKKKKN